MGEKKKILVVDDNTAFTELVEMVFGEEFLVVKAEDGEEGLKLARQSSPDVILLDVMMPRVSGVEMLRSLQAETQTRAIPVVVLTATHFDPSIQGMFRQEPNVRAFLRKPCGVEALRGQIERALGTKGDDGG